MNLGWIKICVFSSLCIIIFILRDFLENIRSECIWDHFAHIRSCIRSAPYQFLGCEHSARPMRADAVTDACGENEGSGALLPLNPLEQWCVDGTKTCTYAPAEAQAWSGPVIECSSN